MSYHLWKETDTLLAATSFQVVTESDDISSQPSFLHTKQPWFPQLLSSRLVFSSLHQLCWSLHTPEQLSAFLVVMGPKPNTVLEVWCWVQRDNHFHSPSSHPISGAGQDATGHLDHPDILPAHIHILASTPRSFFARQLSSHTLQSLYCCMGLLWPKCSTWH